jgi:hypothetical protein
MTNISLFNLNSIDSTLFVDSENFMSQLITSGQAIASSRNASLSKSFSPNTFLILIAHPNSFLLCLNLFTTSK